MSSYSQSWQPYAYEKQEFVGLSNQGATCYMNSLLQSLYMTPEFRLALYNWEYDPLSHDESNDCIPLQLQILFGKLQLSDSIYLETTALTRSFQWDVREGFQQHDVQEFCRVLFDAIEQSVEGTEQAALIKDLYEGSYIDYVKCAHCKHESSREDKFLDLSLTVKNQSERIYNDSIEKALWNYVFPEELTAGNQYFCERCQVKRDAVKGLKFRTLPVILVLQLKRFDLDLETMQRVKLNEEVKFPMILNMNPFMEEHSKERELVKGANRPEESHISQLTRTPVPPDILSKSLSHCVSAADSILKDLDKNPLKLDMIAQKKSRELKRFTNSHENKVKTQEYLQQGEYVYELVSVMIHSGSALGGHYYAYIKSFENDRWYNFNDSSVKEIDEKDLEKAFGGTSKSFGYWASSYSSNAYLLMYRKLRKHSVVRRIDRSAIPPYVLEEIEKERKREKQEIQARIEKQKYIKLSVFYQGKDRQVDCRRDMKIDELKELSMTQFAITEFSPENVRLRGYSHHYDLLKEVFQPTDTLESQGLYSTRILALETKLHAQQWEEYDPYKLTIKVHVWDQELARQEDPFDQMVQNPVKISIDKKLTVREMLGTFEEKFGIPRDQQKVVRKGHSVMNGKPEILSAAAFLDQTLFYVRILEGNTLFLERKEGTQSKWYELLVKDSNKYTLKYNVPGVEDQSYMIRIDSSKTLQELKEKLSEEIGLSAREFILKRGSKFNFEIKDLSLEINQANIANNSIIYLEHGTPAKLNEIKLVFYLAHPPKPDDYDGAVFSYEELCELTLHKETQVASARSNIIEEIRQKNPEMQATEDLLRIRVKIHEKLGKVLKLSDTFSSNSSFEKKSFAVQILERAEPELGPSEILVAVRRWRPSTWELTAPYEITVHKHTAIHDFGMTLSEIYSIPPENLEVHKVVYTYTFMRGELEKETFLHTFNELGTLAEQPWLINADGYLLIVKDDTERLRAMTAGEKNKYGSKHVSERGSHWKHEPFREESVKITVRKKPL